MTGGDACPTCEERLLPLFTHGEPCKNSKRETGFLLAQE
jgi:hypothetical protein